ncbi:uncharacterized protein LOC124149474 [Haliotis rufescens]|uniref:uncharacterized protein LOC124149474 n=1 Tax=Haliotis rufescens TaxID=6454 RepID=UPI001EAFDDD6|nr:uncharacterized protein LOC124149474 [Haliotis rufescens]XP_048247908.1 uncharacterized protein LOC124149474 [Haliotis rufescens]
MRMRTMRADDSDHLTSDSVEASTSRRGSVASSRLPGGLSTGVNPKSKRRGSAVTFDLPDDSDEEERTFRRSCGYRRMSAPELPPIVDRSDSRGNRTSSGSITERSNFYQRFKNGRLPRNHSDSSIKGILTRSPNSQSSSSVNSIPSGQPGYLSSKTRSWCDTDKSAGSTTKLGTLFERKPVSPTRESGSGYRSTSTDRGLSKGHYRLEGELNNNDEEIFPIERYEIDNKRAVLRRNYSENELTANNKRRNSQLSKNALSVGKMDNLTKSTRKNGFNTNTLKRFNSTPAINKTYTSQAYPDRVTEELKNRQLQNGEDSENETERLERIFEWLRGVQFDAEEPPEQVIDYSDDPPQTDTAVHIVYSED